MSQDLLDLLALQKLKKDKEAAQRDLQMQMQAPAATVKDQLAGQVMDMTKQEVAASLSPGIQQQGQAMQAQQLQQAMGGIASQPAPNMVGMARGGIVGYQEGGDVEEDLPFMQRMGGGFRKFLEAIAQSEMMEAEAQRRQAAGVQAALGGVGELASEFGAGVRGETTPPPTTTMGQRYEENLRRLENPRMPVKSLEEALDSNAEAAAYQRSLTSVSPTAPTGPELPPLPPNIGGQAPTRGIPRTGIASTLPEDAGAPVAPTAPARTTQESKFQQQLDKLEAEETNKLGALIEFLLAAGASGGTNLGATLTGGGSGLMARDARIKGQIADTIKNIETLQLEREKLDQDESQFDRTLQQRIAEFTEGQAQFDAEFEQKERKLQSEIQAAMASGGLDLKTMNTLMTTVSELFPPTPELLLDIANKGRKDANQKVLTMEQFEADSASVMSARRKYSDMVLRNYMGTLASGAASITSPTEALMQRGQ
jgi:hypothetical protein